MKINTLTLGNLRNSNHFTFMEFTVAATTKFPYISTTFPTPVAWLKAAFNAENDAYLKSNRSFLTEQVQNANDDRIVRFREVNNILKGAELCSETAKAQAAKFLLSIIKDYGGASKILELRVDQMSGVLTNIVEDFQGRFAAQSAAAGLTECLEELRVANEHYKTLRSQRTDEISQQEKEAMVKARAASDENWHGLIDSVNLRYFYEQDEQLVPFMRYMNTEIDWYRTILGQKPGNSDTNFEGGEVEDGEGSEETPTTPPTTEPSNPGGGNNEPTTPPAGSGSGSATQRYTIIYMHNGQVYTTQEYESGATVTPPAAPEGYIWANVPSTMPTHDVTCNSFVDDDPNEL